MHTPEDILKQLGQQPQTHTTYCNAPDIYHKPIQAVSIYDVVPQCEVTDIQKYDNNIHNILVVSKRQRKEIISRTEYSETGHTVAKFRKSHKSDIRENRQAVPETDITRTRYGWDVYKPNRPMLQTITKHAGSLHR